MEECISRYGGLVHSLARRLLNDPQDAEEAVQDVFADLWRNAERFDPAMGSEKTMVMTIARRRIIDRRRVRERRPDLATAAPADDLCQRPTGDAVEIADELNRVHAVMEELKPEHRRALRLSIFEGWSHSRIAEELGVPLGTIKTHIRRALIQARAALEALPAARTGVQA